MDLSLVRLRPASPDDAQTVFRWRNERFITDRSSSGRPVEWEEHRRWFEASLAGAERRIWIVLAGDEEIGQVRFDRSGPGSCVISVYLLEQFTGLGYGREAIRIACQSIFREWGVERVIACVRDNNRPAQSAFVRCGFQETADQRLCPGGHVVFVLRAAPGSGGPPVVEPRVPPPSEYQS